jgi:NitT/TauT family transport system permease protein
MVTSGPHRLFSSSARRRIGRLGQFLILPVAVIIAWQLGVLLGGLRRTVLPPPSEVFVAAFDLATGATGLTARYSGTLADDAIASVGRVAAGFVIGSSIGIFIGLMIGLSKIAERIFDPTVQVMRNVPVTAWVPLALVFFGIGNAPAVFLIALGAFFPSVINTTHGVRQTDVTLVKAANMMGANYYELLWKVVFPAALPSIMTGLRLSLGVAWVLVVVAEMLAVRSGLGYLLNDSYLFYRNDVVIATMITIGLMGFASDQMIVAIRAWMLGWNRFEVFNGNS